MDVLLVIIKFNIIEILAVVLIYLLSRNVSVRMCVNLNDISNICSLFILAYAAILHFALS